jgi:hypothetical protein
MRVFTCFWLAAALFLYSDTSLGQEERDWGSLTGTFLYDGEIPESEFLNVPRLGLRVRDESLLVGEMEGVKNMVVYLDRAQGEDPPPIHPWHGESTEDEVQMEFKGFRLEPHVALLRTSQTLVVTNKDAVGHGFKFDAFDNPPFNPILRPDDSFRIDCRVRERLPVRATCDVHPWISGVVVVQDHPYMAVTDDRGRFTIRSLPAGKWTFRFWHEKPGAIRSVSRNGKQVDLPGGRLTVTIRPGENRLGTFHLAPEVFARKR